jgi:hypothetical protein
MSSNLVDNLLKNQALHFHCYYAGSGITLHTI